MMDCQTEKVWPLSSDKYKVLLKTINREGKVLFLKVQNSKSVEEKWIKKSSSKDFAKKV
jgi:hypothetical protein